MKTMGRGFSQYLAVCLIALTCQALLASDGATKESGKWREHFSQLKQQMTNSEGVMPDNAKKVFADLEKWGPDYAYSFWNPVMWFRSSYLFNEDVNGQVRGPFLGGMMSLSYWAFTNGKSLEFSLLDVGRAYESGMVMLRGAHDMFYQWWTPNSAPGPFTKKRLCLSGLSVLGHMSAIGSSMVKPGFASPDPMVAAGSLCTYWSLQAFSVCCLIASYWVASGNDYIDVVLESLERGYKKRGMDDELRAVRFMIAHRTPTNKKEKV
ncbi:MAG TPA: hypothetical protein VEL47_01210 [Myxococcota bacterium]|nr:hypothetical protein [Myxococcota bacterium]